MELILMDKYLVRGYEGGFILQRVKEGKEPIVLNGVEKASEAFNNFGRETYHGTFESVLGAIRRQEIATSDIKTLDALYAKLKEIKDIELDIQAKFK